MEEPAGRATLAEAQPGLALGLIRSDSCSMCSRPCGRAVQLLAKVYSGAKNLRGFKSFIGQIHRRKTCIENYSVQITASLQCRAAKANEQSWVCEPRGEGPFSLLTAQT